MQGLTPCVRAGANTIVGKVNNTWHHRLHIGIRVEFSSLPAGDPVGVIPGNNDFNDLKHLYVALLLIFRNPRIVR